MNNALILIAGIVLFGLLFVVVPVVLDVYRRSHHCKVITCPEGNHPVAEVTLQSRLAAFGAAFGKPWLRVRNCSLWPQRMGCDEKCVKENWPEL